MQQFNNPKVDYDLLVNKIGSIQSNEEMRWINLCKSTEQAIDVIQKLRYDNESYSYLEQSHKRYEKYHRYSAINEKPKATIPGIVEDSYD